MRRLWFSTSRSEKSAVLLLVLILVLLPPLTSASLVLLATEALILGIYALSYYLLMASAGMLSFGQATYVGAGSYVVAVLVIRHGMPLWLGFVLAPVAAALMALAIGWFCVRLTRLYFSMLTMAFAQLVWAVAFKWRYLGTSDGIVGLSLDFLGPEPERLYYFAAACLLVVFAVVGTIERSPYGVTLQAIRDNEARARSVGINVRRFRHSAFVIAGGLAGIAGALLAVLNRGVFPDFLYWTVSGEALIMVLLGGSGSIWGALLGATILTFLRKYTSDLMGQHWELALGAVLAVIVLYMPGGVMGALTRLIRLERQRAPGPVGLGQLSLAETGRERGAEVGGEK